MFCRTSHRRSLESLHLWFDMCTRPDLPGSRVQNASEGHHIGHSHVPAHTHHHWHYRYHSYYNCYLLWLSALHLRGIMLLTGACLRARSCMRCTQGVRSPTAYGCSKCCKDRQLTHSLLPSRITVYQIAYSRQSVQLTAAASAARTDS